ncbi:arpin-like [Ylistrum balloti]|uniref:arpin-like n=1 Tax=Ylistrum balloti TaxID=509963 RepID=UPI002905E96A|nr:arpin-like [Ylistrum balloti]
MSRLYDNKPLANLPVGNVRVARVWCEAALVRGEGVIIEGIIKGRGRVVITDIEDSKHRYYLLYVSLDRVHRRKFDSSGNEVEPNFSETQKVRTGYLNSSYKVEAKGQTDRLTNQEATNLLANQELSTLTSKQRPSGCDQCLSLWLQESEADKLEITEGDSVRVKTRGNGPLIFSIAKMDNQSANVSNFAGGEQVGGSWTDKIMGLKSDTPEDEEEEDDQDWD